MAKTDYETMKAQALALTQGVNHLIANLANLSSLIYHSIDDINWAGFYLLEGEELILGPFQGKVACVKIPLGKGVCGTAAKEDVSELVSDVHKFPGHIACDSASRSEVVVPIRKGGKVVGVLDIDSPSVGRFTAGDQRELEAFVSVIEEAVFDLI